MPQEIKVLRIIAEIPHQLMRITILGWNDKYQLRYELDRYEQMFKFDMDAHTIDEVKKIGETMSVEVLLRFVSMREQLMTKTQK
ncbi:MAG: hypothetical protein CMB32_03730 [Euryarchaeota archaeon]|nr:hypothetical protein [Euryarchaeota archaeon]